MPKKKQKPLTISKRAKGFPLRFHYQHLLTLHQTFAWMRQEGYTDEALEETIKLIPTYKVEMDGLTIDDIANGARIPGMHWNGDRAALTIYKSLTVRIRAEHIAPVIRLFDVVAAFICQGQVASTLKKRADKLREVSILDQLYDAQRDSGEAANLSLRD